MYKLKNFWTNTGHLTIEFNYAYMHEALQITVHLYYEDLSCRFVKFDLEKIKTFIAYKKMQNYNIEYDTLTFTKNRFQYRSINEAEFFKYLTSS